MSGQGLQSEVLAASSSGSAAADVFGSGFWSGVFHDQRAVLVKDHQGGGFFDEVSGAAGQEAETSPMSRDPSWRIPGAVRSQLPTGPGIG